MNEIETDLLDAAIERGRIRLDARLQTLSGKPEYPDTAYALPVTYALTGIAVRDAEGAREAYRQSGNMPSPGLPFVTPKERVKHTGSPATTFLSPANA